MKLLFDTFPVLLFVAIYYGTRDIFLATAVAIAATAVQMGVFWARHRRFENMHLISAALIFVLGGLTIVLRDKAFIMWKPTLINWLFAAVFLASPLFGGKPLVERMLAAKVSVPRPVWWRLNHMWVGFFLLAGAANIYFAQSYAQAESALLGVLPQLSDVAVEELDCSSPAMGPAVDLCETARQREELWVNFKLFGLLGMTLVFVLAQAFYLARHISEDSPSVGGREGET